MFGELLREDLLIDEVVLDTSERKSGKRGYAGDQLTSTNRTWYERSDGVICCWRTLGVDKAETEHSTGV